MENSLEDLATSITNTSQHNSDSHSSNSSSTPTNYSSSSSTSASVATKRISPLRGNMPHDELISQTRTVRNGLSALRDDHYNILAGIRDEYENQRNDNQNCRTSNESNNVTNKDADTDSSIGLESNLHLQENVDDSLEARVANVTASLEKLEVGIEESSVMLALSEHFTRMETDREGLRLEVGRVNEENEWLREELSDTQKRLIEAEAELAEIREEKAQWTFMEELKNMNELNIRPVTPSKIPVGKYRVDFEKDINRALLGGKDENGGTDSNRTSRSTSPTTVSRIPVGHWRNKTSAYKKLMERQEKKELSNSSDRNSRQYFKFNGRNGINSNNNNVSNYNYKKKSLQNGGHVHRPLTTSNGVVGHVGLMSNSSHARAGGHGSKIPSR
jgi:hypothetical protein